MLYALGDLHLGHSVEKPMDVFGSAWERHPEQIRENWMATITSEDVVLLPGDLSWAMTLAEAKADLEWLAQLPGRQVMIRGNHDYWWSGIGRVRKSLGANQTAIQNDAIAVNDYAVCGTRGWLLPSHPNFEETDEVIFRRELERLKLSLEAGLKLRLPLVVMMHYPPCSITDPQTAFTKLIEQYPVKLVVYGHLHGSAQRFCFEGDINGVAYHLVSADYLQFQPKPLML